jgi:hypothetical protein
VDNALDACDSPAGRLGKGVTLLTDRH